MGDITVIRLPAWARPFLLDTPCPDCGSKKEQGCVIAVGAREIVERPPEENGKNKIGLFFEYVCPYCDKHLFILADPDERGITVETILNEIILACRSSNAPKKNKIRKSAISEDEIKELSKILSNSVNHEDFMRNIGIEDDLIYNYKNNKDNE